MPDWSKLNESSGPNRGGLAGGGSGGGDRPGGILPSFGKLLAGVPRGLGHLAVGAVKDTLGAGRLLLYDVPRRALGNETAINEDISHYLPTLNEFGQSAKHTVGHAQELGAASANLLNPLSKGGIGFRDTAYGRSVRGEAGAQDLPSLLVGDIANIALVAGPAAKTLGSAGGIAGRAGEAAALSGDAARAARLGALSEKLGAAGTATSRFAHGANRVAGEPLFAPYRLAGKGVKAAVKGADLGEVAAASRFGAVRSLAPALEGRGFKGLANTGVGEALTPLADRAGLTTRGRWLRNEMQVQRRTALESSHDLLNQMIEAHKASGGDPDAARAALARVANEDVVLAPVLQALDEAGLVGDERAAALERVIGPRDLTPRAAELAANPTPEVVNLAKSYTDIVTEHSTEPYLSGAGVPEPSPDYYQANVFGREPLDIEPRKVEAKFAPMLRRAGEAVDTAQRQADAAGVRREQVSGQLPSAPGAGTLLDRVQAAAHRAWRAETAEAKRVAIADKVVERLERQANLSRKDAGEIVRASRERAVADMEAMTRTVEAFFEDAKPKAAEGWVSGKDAAGKTVRRRAQSGTAGIRIPEPGSPMRDYYDGLVRDLGGTAKVTNVQLGGGRLFGKTGHMDLDVFLAQIEEKYGLDPAEAMGKVADMLTLLNESRRNIRAVHAEGVTPQEAAQWATDPVGHAALIGPKAGALDEVLAAHAEQGGSASVRAGLENAAVDAYSADLSARFEWEAAGKQGDPPPKAARAGLDVGAKALYDQMVASDRAADASGLLKLRRGETVESLLTRGRKAGIKEGRFTETARVAEKRLGVAQRWYDRLDAKMQARLAEAADSTLNLPARYRPVVGLARDAAAEIESLMKGQPDHVQVKLAQLQADLPTGIIEALDRMDPGFTKGGKLAERGTGAGTGFPRLRKLTSQHVKEGGLGPRTLPEQTQLLVRDIFDRAQNETALSIRNNMGTSGKSLGLDLTGKDLLEAVSEQTGQPMAGWNVASPFQTVLPDAVTPNTVLVPKWALDAFGDEFKVGHAEQIARVLIDKPVRLWKASVLPMSAQWHIGNALSQVLMAWSGKVSPLDLIRNAVESKRLMASEGVPGLRGRGFTAEHGQFLEATKAGEGRLPRLTASRNPLSRVTNAGYRANGWVDDWFHHAVYLTKKSKGLTDEAAVSEALRMMGDFDNLSPFERRTVKRIVPFYPWVRHITKLTAHLAINDPVRLAWAMHLSDMFRPEGTADDLPWLAGAEPLGNNLFMPLGFADPTRTVTSTVDPANPLGSAATTLSPVIQWPLISLLGQDIGPGGLSVASRKDKRYDENWREQPIGPLGLGGSMYQLGQLFPQVRAAQDLLHPNTVRYDTGEKIEGLDNARTDERWKSLLGGIGVPFPSVTDVDRERARIAKRKRAAERSGS